MQVHFWYLTAFTRAGGIELFNRAFMKFVSDAANQKGFQFKVYSLHDAQPDKRYLHTPHWKGFRGNRLQFVVHALKEGFSSDVLFIGHIHLAPVAMLLKWLHPRCRIMVICHGIEVWEPLSGFQKKLLQKADMVFSVSKYTRNQLISLQHVHPDRVYVFPSTLDPFFPVPQSIVRPEKLIKAHNLKEHQKIILSVCRLSAQEQYKGYDIMIKAMPMVCEQIPDVVYVIVGKYDIKEYYRIMQIAEETGVKDKLILTGYVPDDQLIDYYQLADIFVLPSTGEGFGVVYLEALAYGLPVIAYDAGGVREVLEHVNHHILLSTLEPKVLAESCVELLTKEAKKEPILPYSVDKFKDNIARIIDMILKNVE